MTTPASGRVRTLAVTLLFAMIASSAVVMPGVAAPVPAVLAAMALGEQGVALARPVTGVWRGPSRGQCYP